MRGCDSTILSRSGCGDFQMVMVMYEMIVMLQINSVLSTHETLYASRLFPSTAGKQNIEVHGTSAFLVISPPRNAASSSLGRDFLNGIFTAIAPPCMLQYSQALRSVQAIAEFSMLPFPVAEYSIAIDIAC
jgi:hypothetical protein